MSSGCKSRIGRFRSHHVRLGRGGMWEVVRPQNSHVGQRYAVPCAQACRRNSTLSESSESFIWRARGVQASQAPPEEGRALTRGVLRNGNEELRRAPEPSGAARSSGGRWLGAHFSDLKTPTTVRAQPAGVAGLGERRQLLLSSQPRCRELAAISTASQSMQNDSVSMRRFLRTI